MSILCDEQQLCPICFMGLADDSCWYPCCHQHFLHIECYLKSALLYKSQCPIDRRFIRYVKFGKSIGDIRYSVYLSAGHMMCEEKLFYSWQQVSTDCNYRGLFAHFWSTSNFLPFAICLKRRNAESQSPRYVTFLNILVRGRGDVEILRKETITSSMADYIICLETYATDDFINQKDLVIETKCDFDLEQHQYSFHISVFQDVHKENLQYFINN